MEGSRSESQGADGLSVMPVSDLEVLDEIKLLCKLKERLMQPADGRDFLAAVNAQLRVLKEGLCQECVRSIWGVADEALNPNWFITLEATSACRWLWRDRRLRGKPPSQSWTPYLVDRRKSSEQTSGRPNLRKS